MKNTVKNLFYWLAVAVFAVSCAESDDYSTPDSVSVCVDETVGKTANVTGTQLYAMATSSMQQFSIEGEDYLEAYVTSSDAGGNFFKSVSMETADGKGFSISVDMYNTYTKGFEVGRKVFIRLNGLRFWIAHNSLVLGVLYTNPATGAESVGRIPEIQVSDIIFKSCEYKDEEELVHHVTVAQAKNNNYINKLIELSEVEFVEMGLPYYDPNDVLGGATNRNIRDVNDNTVIFRTSDFATYAGYNIPQNSGKVRGVMTKYSSDFQFIARVHGDIKLDQPVLGEPEPVEPVEPGEDAVLAFPGADFENWTDFTGHLNSFGLKSYATQSAGTGRDGSNSLKINTSGAGGNDYVFTSLAYDQLPANPTVLRFWMKGTSSKTVSINIYKEGSGYFVFNLGDVTASKTLTVSPSNQYTGTIDTGGEWVQITLDLTTVDAPLNLTNFSADFFALKVGSGQPYDLHFDEFTIE